VGQDITAVKRAQAESEERYRYLFHESPSGSIILAIDGRVLDINASFLESLGYAREEILGRPATDFIIPEQRSRVAETMARRLAGEYIPNDEYQIIVKNNAIRNVIFAGGCAKLKDPQGRLTSILLCGEDITERRRAEVSELRHREEMARTDRMASLGILVSGVAHEINNPNNFIILNADNLKDIWKDVTPVLDRHAAKEPEYKVAGLPYSEVRDETARLIQGIQEGARRIKTIVQHLKDFARQAPSDMEQTVDLNGVVEAAVTILGALIRKSTDHFKFAPPVPAPLVRGDFQKLEQVVINLITNACHALGDRSRKLTVDIHCSADEERAFLVVSDGGRGIPVDVLPHIFDPFFTTKRDQGGTGLGLSISYGIAQDHKGSLTVRSTEGQGAVFTLELPAICRKAVSGGSK